MFFLAVGAGELENLNSRVAQRRGEGLGTQSLTWYVRHVTSRHGLPRPHGLDDSPYKCGTTVEFLCSKSR